MAKMCKVENGRNNMKLNEISVNDIAEDPSTNKSNTFIYSSYKLTEYFTVNEMPSPRHT